VSAEELAGMDREALIDRIYNNGLLMNVLYCLCANTLFEFAFLVEGESQFYILQTVSARTLWKLLDFLIYKFDL